MIATWDGTCDRCDQPVVAGQTVVLVRRAWVHSGCHSGAEE